MKILLKEDVEKIGVAGDVVTVADGYARNYLIPKQLAVKATPGQLKQVHVIRRQAHHRRERIAAMQAELAEKLTGLLLTFEANASEKGRLYGSVTRDDMAAALEARIGEPIDRRKIETEPLRQIGFHTIRVRINAELIPEVAAIVHREGEDPVSYLSVEEEIEEPETEVEVEAETEVEEAPVEE